MFDDPNERMVAEQIEARGIRDPRVLDAFRSVRREWFVPDELKREAWEDSPLPIGDGQTISQPYIVAYMTEALAVGPEDRVLEIGTGSVYQTAILARLARHVYTAEIVPSLAEKAQQLIRRLNLTNVTMRTGDALRVFADEAPFDAILAAAAPDRVPEDLLAQMAEGGRAILPVGGFSQSLLLLKKEKGAVLRQELIGVRFVPLTRDSHPPK